MLLSICVVAVLSACSDDEAGTVADPAELAVTYIGSDACAQCHTQPTLDVIKSGHPYKLNKVVNGQPPSYPFSTVPDPPAGVSWNDVTYVIGGFGWKARFLGTDGYIITAGGQNQYNLATGGWSDYHKDEVKPYDCGACHTTGYSSAGHQDGLEGIIGTWSEPDIQCEACHGPGSAHAENPTGVPVSVDTRAEQCGSCHNRGGVNNVVIAKGGFIRHHEQYNELQQSTHRNLDCVTCHDPHTGIVYNDLEGAQALNAECDDCHTTALASLQTAPLAAFQKDTLACMDCHMPKAAKSAVSLAPFVGDISSHIFAINSDSLAEQFSTDGSTANPYITTEFACLSCHPNETKGWAAVYADSIHGPNFKLRPLAAPIARGRR